LHKQIVDCDGQLGTKFDTLDEEIWPQKTSTHTWKHVYMPHMKTKILLK